MSFMDDGARRRPLGLRLAWAVAMGGGLAAGLVLGLALFG
jgi:hypothetical protein